MIFQLCHFSKKIFSKFSVGIFSLICVCAYASANAFPEQTEADLELKRILSSTSDPDLIRLEPKSSNAEGPPAKPHVDPDRPLRSSADNQDNQENQNATASAKAVDTQKFDDLKAAQNVIAIQEMVEFVNRQRQVRTYPAFIFTNGTWQSREKGEDFLNNLQDASNDFEPYLSSYTPTKQFTYTGWRYTTELKVYTSAPYAADPEKWLSRSMAPDTTALMITAFKQKFPEIKYEWGPADLKVEGAYESAKGAWLVGVSMAEKMFKGRFMPKEEFAPNWFYIYQGQVKYLGSNLYPLFSADFQNNGQSEWLMAFSSPEEQGYILFLNDFEKQLRFGYKDS